MHRSEREARVIALLQDCVRTQLKVTDGGFGLGLGDEAIERLMAGVTSGILYAFAVDWAPDWVRQGDVHSWEDSGAWFARCGVCLLDSSPAATREEAAARAHADERSH